MDTEQKIEITALQASIINHLGIGKDNAIRLKDLQKRLGMSERKIRIAIEALRNEGYLILVPASPPYGYYLAKSQDEVDEFIKYMRSRVIDECHVMRSVRLASKRKFAREFGQIPMILK